MSEEEFHLITIDDDQIDLETFSDEINQENSDDIQESDNVFDVFYDDKDDLNESDRKAVFEEITNKHEVYYESTIYKNVNKTNLQNVLTYENSIDVIINEDPNKYVNIAEFESNLFENECIRSEIGLEEFEYYSDETLTANSELKTNKNIVCNANEENAKIEINNTKNNEQDNYIRGNEDDIKLELKCEKQNIYNTRVPDKNGGHKIISSKSEVSNNANEKTLKPINNSAENTSNIPTRKPNLEIVHTNTSSAQKEVINYESLLQQVNVSHQDDLELDILQSYDSKRETDKNEQYTCNVCGKIFSRSTYLKRHNRIHTGEKLYPCKVCGKTFSTSSHLKTHSRLHTGEKPFTCNVCGKAFNNSSTLKLHNRLHTGEKPYTCNVCGKTFNRSKALKTHNRKHTGEKPCSCSICGKSFNNSNNLNIHNRLHTGEKPYSCDICGESYSRSSYLKAHSRIHTGDKPCACNICGKAFYKSSVLNTHKRIHTGEKPYSCNVCGKAFNISSNLKTHRRLHTGEKPFTCNVCGKAFYSSSHLVRHNRTHTGEKPYSCEICPQKYKNKISLAIHLKKHIQLVV